MIDLTPLDVRKKKGDFRRIMRGYDPALVDDFLDVVAERLEQLVRENLALTERTGRQDQQVSEYRERERALTEALVTAQEMREEIRKQTAREADLAKRSAEQEAAQLRTTVQAEVKELRAAAQQEAAQLRGTAQAEVKELRATAQREVKELRTLAQREAAQVRSNVMLEREREEEAFRRLRGRQEQFLTGYRAFLERELSEVSTLARSLGLPSVGETTAGARTRADDGFALGTVGPGAAAAAFMGAHTDATARPELDDFSASPMNVDDFDTAGDDPDLLDLSFAETVEDSSDLGLTDERETPFEPEPFEREPLIASDEAQTMADDLVNYGAEPTATAGIDVDSDVWSPPPEWDVPGLVVEETVQSLDFELTADVGVGDDSTETEDASLLLRNAEAAGYHTGELEQDLDELLLEEEPPAPKPKSTDDDGWLPSLLDDDT